MPQPILIAGGGIGGLTLALMLHERGIAAVAALSGVYDLEPLTGTPLNDKLQLDPATARAMSPLHRVRIGMPPALFAVGGLETAAFQQQTADMHAAWLHTGNRSRHLVVDGADHFSLLRHLQRPGPLLQGILDLIQHA